MFSQQLFLLLKSALCRLIDLLWRRTEVPWLAYAALAAGVAFLFAHVASGLAYLVLTPAGGGAEMPARMPTGLLLAFTALVWAPIVETLVLAVLVALARRLAQSERTHVLAGALPMGAGHAFRETAVVQAVGSVMVTTAAFLVMAMVYVAWRRVGVKEALGMCALVHALHNALVMAALPIWS